MSSVRLSIPEKTFDISSLSRVLALSAREIEAQRKRKSEASRAQGRRKRVTDRQRHRQRARWDARETSPYATRNRTRWLACETTGVRDDLARHKAFHEIDWHARRVNARSRTEMHRRAAARTRNEKGARGERRADRIIRAHAHAARRFHGPAAGGCRGCRAGRARQAPGFGKGIRRRRAS